jgi:hypothetical protein
MIDFALTFSRYFVAGITGALLSYWLYWAVASLFVKHRDVKPWCAVLSVRLQAGGTGYLRLYLGWVVAFTVYGLIATYESPPFTWDWWYNAILDGDWVVILVAPLLFAYPFWRRATAKARLAIPESINALVRGT